jgi:fructosamine-3-kinase
VIWKREIAEVLDVDPEHLRLEGVSGGCINQTYKLTAASRTFFLKTHSSPPKDFFHLEAQGLEQLASTNSLRIPRVLASRKNFLLLEWCEPQREEDGFFEHFARQLAALHRNSRENYGWPRNNYLGILPQNNDDCPHFKDFFWRNRIEALLEHPLLDRTCLQLFQKLETRLHRLFDDFEDRPSLIHGDLWSGNFLCDRKQQVVVFDPAVCFSHREMELAFTELFGGFPQHFYKSYHEDFPLPEDYQKRKYLFNLYPLLVHVHLFGASYLPQLEEALKISLKS